MTEHDANLIRGAGGGSTGGGSKKGNAASDVNTLRSNARSTLVWLLSEGTIGALPDNKQWIYFNQTPVENADGSQNFGNVTVQHHVGLADEGYFNGIDGVETNFEVNTQVFNTAGPVQRTIVDANVDRLRVIARLPALVRRDANTGAIYKTSVSYAFDVQPYGGSWSTVVQNDIVNEKTTSPYQVAHDLPLPAGGAPWNVRMRRITADSTDENLQNDTYWDGYVEIVSGKYTYPYSAAAALEVDAQDLGSSLPQILFKIPEGIKVEVPTNFDPVARTFTGIWDGTFKLATTDDPCWIFRDLVNAKRYGLGEFVNSSIVDKWTLYAISQNNQVMVPSGYKDADGNDILEPRYTFNGVIQNADDAFSLLQQVAASWRGMTYWSHGQVFPTADMPADASKIVAPANTIGGFNYSGTALKSRNSVVIVSFNDPDNFGQSDYEVVVSPTLLQRFGWRAKSVQLMGCYSRGLAHRYGKWILDTEENETKTVEWSASLDQIENRPGDIVAIADPGKAGVRIGGRILSHVGNVVTLDRAFEPGTGQTYSLLLVMPSGKVETQPIESFDGGQVTVSSAFSDTAAPDAMFAISGSDVTPKPFRIIVSSETAKNVFKMTALEHDPTKYDRVEQNLKLEQPNYSRAPTVSYAPTAIDIVETAYILNGEKHAQLTCSWTPSAQTIAVKFRVSVDTPADGTIQLGDTTSNSIDLTDVAAGDYTFHVRAIGLTGIISPPADSTFTAVGPEGLSTPTVTDVRLADRPLVTTFVGRDVQLAWTNNFPVSSDPDAPGSTPSSGVSPLYAYNTVEVFASDGTTLLRSVRITGEAFTYTHDMNAADSAAASLPTAQRDLFFQVSIVDIYGRSSSPVVFETTNPKPAKITPTLSSVGQNISVKWPAQDDPDYAGTKVWIETSATFDPDTATPKFDGTGGSYVFTGDENTTYHVRVAGYDAFDKTGLNVSDDQTITTTSFGAAVSQEMANITGPLIDDIYNRFASYDEAFGDFAIQVADNSNLSQKKITGLSVRNAATAASIVRMEETILGPGSAFAALTEDVATLKGGYFADALLKLETDINDTTGVTTISFKVQATDGNFTSTAALQIGASVGPDGPTSFINAMADTFGFVTTDGTLVSRNFAVNASFVEITELRFKDLKSLDGTTIVMDGTTGFASFTTP